MKFYTIILASCWLILCSVAGASSETIYVADQLVITLRQGKSTQHKIIKTINTGTSMELLEEIKDDPYVKVRLAGGEEGYVLVQYTSKETPKTTIINRLQSEVDRLKSRSAELEKKREQLAEELQSVKGQNVRKEEELNVYATSLDRELVKSREELQGLTAKYEALLDKSKKVVEISTERDALQESTGKLSFEVQKLRDENSRLKRSGVIKWFLAGGGVFFFGWLIGKVSRKRKQGLTL